LVEVYVGPLGVLVIVGVSVTVDVAVLLDVGDAVDVDVKGGGKVEVGV
jgi:hypothetical protein